MIAAAATGAGMASGVFKWRHERRAHVTVTVSAGIFVYGWTPGDDVSAIVTAVNEDLKSVTVTNVWLEHLHGSSGPRAFFPRPPLGATIPGTIEGRQKGMIGPRFRSSSVTASQSPTWRLSAWSRPPPGETFRSQPATLFFHRERRSSYDTAAGVLAA